MVFPTCPSGSLASSEVYLGFSELSKVGDDALRGIEYRRGRGRRVVALKLLILTGLYFR